MDYANKRFRSQKYNRLSSNYLREVQNANAYKTQVTTHLLTTIKRATL